MRIDAHVHVWDLERADYEWLRDAPASINRSISLDEVRPELREARIDGVVLVQAADNADDTRTMFAAAATHPEVVGVVGYVPLDRPDAAADTIDNLRKDPLFVGVRTLIHDLPDPDWLLRPNVDEGLGLLEDADIPFDLVAVLPRHLELIPLIAERHPALRIVIDHLSKPPIGLDSSEPWKTLIATAAENPNVFAKVSGLYAAGEDPSAWTPELVRPFFDHAVDSFGPARLMYGGDWPVSLLAGGYSRVWTGLSELFDDLDEADRNRILGQTASEFYRLDLTPSISDRN